MPPWKLPPRVKIYEALGAVADDRVSISEPGTAQVVSSSGEKTYTVQWSPDLREINANDNASYWQGYLGYPIVAVLLALKVIAFNPADANSLAGIPWKTLNTQFKRDYDAVIAHVLQQVEAHGGDPQRLQAEVERIINALAALDLQRPEKRMRLPGK